MTVNAKHNRRMRLVLYSLKKEYAGGPVTIYSLGDTTTDLQTGEVVTPRSVTTLQKVIILPATISREVVQSISQISANKAFVYGGYFDGRTRNFIIDRSDAPGLELNEDDWLVFNNHKYEIEDIREFEFDMGYVVRARQILGVVPEQIHELKADHFISLESETANNE